MVSIMEIMQLCRLCLVKEQVNIPIFEDQGDIRQIFLKITACLPVKVSKEDQLPKKICDGCLYKLELLYQFWNTTANAEKQLLSWIEQSNMELNSKSSDEPSTNTPPQVKQEKIEPTESTNENADLSADAQNYILQQQQLAYQAEFPYKESQGSNVEGEDAADDSEEPVPKRRRRSQRRQATKPIPPESLDSSDNEAADTFMEMAVTKTEEESESDGDENVDDPESSKFVTATEDPEQPGPSGLGKGTTEAPSKMRKYKAHRRIQNFQATEQNNREKGLPWLCRKCNKQFSSSRKLKRHRKEDHLPNYSKSIYKYICDPISKTYSCKICNLETKIKTEIEEHVLTHEDKFTCELCQEILYSAYKYAVHIYTHKDDGTYRCPLCQYSTTRRSTIFQHINTVHLQNYSYECKHCGKGFRDGITYREHENLHISSNTMKCVVCDKEFSYTRNLVLHQTRNHRVTTIDPQSENQCTICKKSFTRANNLKKHMEIHDTTTGSRPHLCEWCGKGFNDKTTLNHHNRIHTGYKPYKCNYCEKTFSKKGYLILHERTHTGEKPHCCKHCGKGFNQLTSLKVHVRTHTGEKPYRCHLCDSSYISKVALKSHIISCFG